MFNWIKPHQLIIPQDFFSRSETESEEPNSMDRTRRNSEDIQIPREQMHIPGPIPTYAHVASQDPPKICNSKNGLEEDNEPDIDAMIREMSMA
eukprot:CAMPEP_0196574450 /NCGR_PEP_ID=MMETSP1081-20130531/4165_1 /TAXON_ID=36882 /ORGANISM="Pyramimonas amylifera, Strain CCMP720" /LENGTH=92 /DNA_ID=CAMNT_0041892471 /DNA_START=108 /DNA_END=386 /DNA_ORIENTATION=-